MTPETIEKLLRKGIPVDGIGKFVNQGLLDKTAKVPICVVLLESKDPDEEEIKTLLMFIGKSLRKFDPKYISKNGRLAQGANTVTFCKCDGYWKIHRLNWGDNAWINVRGHLKNAIGSL